MRRGIDTVVLGGTLLCAACVPAGGNFQGGGFGPGPGPANPATATARELNEFLADGSAYIEHFANGPWGPSYECGYFSGDGYYESIWVNDYGDYDEFDGAWSVRGSQLCIDGGWYSGDGPLGCVTGEWSTGDSLLLVDGSNQVIAELFAYDGPGEYYDNACFF
ncbi:MAG: hypothetical protein R3F55_21335 [Alphaproteobacteria bacterium]